MATLLPPRGCGIVKQFRGIERTATPWKALHKDADLWLDDGDCLVYFYEAGSSQQGPSLCIRYSHIQALESSYLSQRCQMSQHGSSQHSQSTADDASPPRPESKPHELYLPAPSGLPADQAYHYHLATRNCFALAASLPLVGEKLGTALVRTWDRLVEWKCGVCQASKMWDYCEEQGYRDFSGLPNHALACLALAEKAHMRNLWIDAFVHCVGQRENLFCSPEYDGISQTTKALIMRASLEMDLHIERVIRALGSFLEEELGTEHLGLSKAAREHLDRFRSCLHRYYVEKLGYFPPKQDARFNKRMWTKMYHSFHALYDYLVDTESDADMSNTRGMNGGVCVVQNVLAFDQRHGYAPLPHPLPLLPDASAPRPAIRRVDSASRGLRGFKLTRFDAVLEKPTERELLTKATNPLEVDVADYPLLQEYQRFERQRLEEKLSISEARKVRWLLIYGVLQMLLSITRAPEHVRDAEISPYPLCVLLTGCPPWADAEAECEPTTSSSHASSLLTLPQRNSIENEDRLSIHPDCEADCAEDFFAAHTLSRQGSDLSLNMNTHPLRITTQLSRTASIRSSVNLGVHALHRSMVGSLSRRNSLRTSRRHSVASLDLSPCVENEFSQQHTSVTRPPDQAFGLFDFGLNTAEEPNNQEPILELDHLPALDGSTDLSPDTQELARSHSDASSSGLVSHTTSSTRSSLLGDYDSPATEVSISWADDSPGGIDGTTKSSMPLAFVGESFTPSSPSKRVGFHDQMLGVGVYTPYASSVSMGCYVPTGYSPNVYIPTGMSEPSKPAKRRTLSGESCHWSPVNGTEQEQEVTLEEEPTRGRQRPGMLDCIDEYDVAEGRESSLPA